MPAAPPRREAATRAARNIHSQYTAPFGPRPTYVSKLGNTATRYDKVDRAYRSGGSKRRASAGVAGGSGVGNDKDDDGSGPVLDQESASIMATTIKGNSTVRPKLRSESLIETLLDYESEEDDTPHHPVGNPVVAPVKTVTKKELPQLTKPKSQRELVAAQSTATGPSRSHKLRRVEPVARPRASTSHKTSIKQLPRETSPLSASRSSAKGEIKPQRLILSPSPPSSPLSRLPTALPSRSASPPYPPPAPMLDWWAEVSPQPPSSPPGGIRHPFSIADLQGPPASLQPIHEQPQSDEELSNSANSRLTPLRWSPVSVLQSPLSDQDPRVQDRLRREFVQSPSSPNRPRLSEPDELIVTPHFKPRSQAFQGFPPDVRTFNVRPAVGLRREEGADPLAQLRGAWELYVTALEQFRQAMETFLRGQTQ